MTTSLSILLALLITLALIPVGLKAAESDSTGVADVKSDSTGVADAEEVATATTAVDDEKSEKNQVTYLVPSLKDAGYHVSKDRQKYKNRISFSPAFGQLGTQDVFAFRIGYSPNTWLGYEIALEHNPASSLHALLHTFNVILRHPLPWRAQPYVTLGYGMITVFPGRAINADPVTKNTLTAGGGLEFYIRDDVALRGEIRSATILGQELGSDGTVAYSYREYTIGFAFYRNLGR